MTYETTPAEIAFDAAVAAYKAASASFKRSRSEKNRVALVSATALLTITAKVFRQEQETLQTAFLAALEVVAIPVPQGELFA